MSEQTGSDATQMEIAKPWLWKKGQSGNPHGRPRHSIREHIRRSASLKGEDGKTNAKAVADWAWLLARTGDLDAIKFVTEQLDGKAPAIVQVDGEVDHRHRIDLSSLTDEEFALLGRIVGRTASHQE